MPQHFCSKISILFFVVARVILMPKVLRAKTGKGHNREHGTAYPSGTKTVAAPATVNDGFFLKTKPLVLLHREGEKKQGLRFFSPCHCEPGDLPSFNRAQALKIHVTRRVLTND
ncbi:hypothetical protein MNBD_ALPHA11-77 [hydrothermal vent metagenome]|uniref:Uncharacterized protein n=1 Tax=hydrothermal vent metagenome TaxID=652676 RepID=A0A3B0U341_9ZZZZ